MSYQSYLVQLRLSHAARELIETEHTITTIAFDCGFSGSAPFARAFKDFYKMSASEWRSKGHLEESNMGKMESNKSKTISKKKRAELKRMINRS